MCLPLNDREWRVFFAGFIGVAATVHAIRFLAGWPVVINNFSIPVPWSGFIAVIGWGLAYLLMHDRKLKKKR